MINLRADNRIITELIGQIEKEDLHLIDFDEVKKKLQEIQIVLEQSEKNESELSQLREDYQNRIAGMVKAIAAVDWGRRDVCRPQEDVLDYLERLNELNAAELINEYRKTSASFRSAFPASFGLLSRGSGGNRRMRNPEVYK